MDFISSTASNSMLLPTFISGFILVYTFSYFIIFQTWSPKTRSNAASCIISLAHGTPAVLLAAHALITRTTETSPVSKNNEMDDLVLDFSIAYFLTDLGHLVLFSPTDVLFIGHHVATTYVFATCRYFVGYGGTAILKLLIAAEITSGLQNLWTFAEMVGAERVFKAVSPLFYVMYTVARCAVGPVLVWEMGVFYWSGSGGGGGMIPGWVWASWMVVIVAAVVVSQLWILNLWVVWFGERSKSWKKVKLSE